MRIAVSGAPGFIGKALVPFLHSRGHEVSVLVRSDKDLCTHEINWDPPEGYLPPEKMENFDAVINLSGRSISAYWTNKVKEEILTSRVEPAQLLVKTFAKLKNPPKTFISVSAVGYYGNRASQDLTEQSSKGQGFLPDVCEAWEAASATPICRVVNPRLGVVLDKSGGALAKMLPLFKLGLGGVIASGKQWMSWIALPDLLELFEFILKNETVKGPINAVTPHPITNRTFTKTLGALLHRPTIFPLPDFLARFLLGQMADETLLSSTKALPEALLAAGFAFKYPELKQALESELSEKR